MKKELSPEQTSSLLEILKARFEKNMGRHQNIDWNSIQSKLEGQSNKLWTLKEMEDTGGEPDVVVLNDDIVFCDCSAESPSGRRNVCYDQKALEARKKFPPKSSVEKMAKEIGIELLTEEQYKALQQLGKFDQKSSSWIVTPEAVRKHGGALFCDYRYEHVFTYHNGADSYYSARGFRGFLSL